MNAYRIGYIAGWSGNDNCPYKPDTQDYLDWHKGYEEGVADAA